MNDLKSLKPVQVDALREVANIGAGHAATALSQMTGSTIMMNSVRRSRSVSLISFFQIVPIMRGRRLMRRRDGGTRP